ncbi:hypothetical protein PGTUg99_006432 [Puccinia graminis f. sp. tritici]|uniref:Uncharacterized protein n=2 Tax=Puccinia graminis f. sp. tritici TaxID=56615 RepID=E3JZL4_PUCGT|nr:uncharacterized protein PGTG_03445 [Puccinia graminis f. sp. tritici CRL 75-36-700-3]EFP77489.2 hypothetical protein PGTG_03445 [Puccinia graminis f. sp. tritici CRL 75-36-700-3]KAA1064191.1 hypothetical protein PGTUg99_006432 [Puccinia graminis f. sp. tritici]
MTFTSGNEIVIQERAGPTIHLPTEIPEEIHEKHNPFPLGNIKMSSSKLPTVDKEDQKSISSVDEPRRPNNPHQKDGNSIIQYIANGGLKELPNIISQRFQEMFDGVPGSRNIQKFASTWGLYLLTFYIFMRDQPFFLWSKQRQKLWSFFLKSRYRRTRIGSLKLTH